MTIEKISHIIKIYAILSNLHEMEYSGDYIIYMCHISFNSFSCQIGNVIKLFIQQYLSKFRIYYNITLNAYR